MGWDPFRSYQGDENGSAFWGSEWTAPSAYTFSSDEKPKRSIPIICSQPAFSKEVDGQAYSPSRTFKEKNKRLAKIKTYSVYAAFVLGVVAPASIVSKSYFDYQRNMSALENSLNYWNQREKQVKLEDNAQIKNHLLPSSEKLLEQSRIEKIRIGFDKEKSKDTLYNSIDVAGMLSLLSLTALASLKSNYRREEIEIVLEELLSESKDSD